MGKDFLKLMMFKKIAFVDEIVLFEKPIDQPMNFLVFKLKIPSSVVLSI